MEARIPTARNEDVLSVSTTSSVIESLSYHQSDEVTVGCSTNDECSETNSCALESTFKIEDHQDAETKPGPSTILHQTKIANFKILSDLKGAYKPAHYCPCNPYGKVQELKRSIREGQQNTESPNISTCRLGSRCAIWVDNLFTKIYGSFFTDGLVFAVDAVMLMRHLNELQIFYIIYPTSNTAPPKPCDQKLDDVFSLILKTSSDKIEQQFDEEMNGKDVNYKNFQILLVQKSRDWEKAPYEAKEFLMYCVTIGQWAVCAEKKGIKRACYFAPLVICRTIHRLRIWRKIPPTFWEDLAEAADKFGQTYS